MPAAPTRNSVLSGVLLAVALTSAPLPALAQPSDCAAEAARIRRAETELPRLDVAPPGDRQIVCITLETNMLFARRLAAHIAHCPRSPLARQANAWTKTATDYAAQFRGHGCKPAIRPYRG